MSRSFKKTPRCGQTKDKFFKKYANRKFRRHKLNTDLKHNSYKKNFCYYNICDYEDVGTTFEQYWLSCIRCWHRWGYHSNPYPVREEAYKEYCRWYKRK